jgi:hypothetical protein
VFDELIAWIHEFDERRRARLECAVWNNCHALALSIASPSSRRLPPDDVF